VRGRALFLQRPLSPALTNRKSIQSATSAQQVDDENYQSHNQEYVDQAPADMQTETQKPQNHKNYKNRPKHNNLLFTPEG
jgi:hypothetical protein